LIGRAASNLSTEQQELLDSGLRMLAHMIAVVHIRRISLNKANKGELLAAKCRELPEAQPCNKQLENQGE
jgi:hypothetical protein